jgi:predicted MFS family arabinose efflux permease
LPLTVGVVLLASFVWVESRASQPILPLRLFASAERSGANAARVLFVGASMGFFFYVTQYLQGVLGMRPILAGVAFFPSMLANFLGALAAPKLARRVGNRTVLIGALSTSLVGMVWLGQMQAGAPFLLTVGLPMVLVGAGMGSSLALLTISGVAGVEPRDAGSASGLVGVAHQLGGAFGLGLLVVVFASVSAAPQAGAAAELTHRVGMAITAGAGLLFAALIFVLLYVGRRKD